MDVGEGHSHGICGIIGRWVGEAQESYHHVFYLLFLGATVADNGRFDLRRTVGCNVEIESAEHRENDASAFGKREAGLWVEA